MKDVLIIALCIPAGAAFGWRMANEIERWAPKAVWPLAIFMIVGLVAIITARVPDGWPATVAIGAGWIAGVAGTDYRRRRHAALEAELRSIAAEGGIRDENGNPIDPEKVHIMPAHMERELRRREREGPKSR